MVPTEYAASGIDHPTFVTIANACPGSDSRYMFPGVIFPKEDSTSSIYTESPVFRTCADLDQLARYVIPLMLNTFARSLVGDRRVRMELLDFMESEIKTSQIWSATDKDKYQVADSQKCSRVRHCNDADGKTNLHNGTQLL
jgi:hypothetical protein